MLLATGSQLTTALALIELDGVARRITLCRRISAPNISRPIAAGADATRSSMTAARSNARRSIFPRARHLFGPTITPSDLAPAERIQTEWILLTSGTTGVPKMVVHSLAGLTAAIKRGQAAANGAVVWGTFYDIRRYGGLQIFLRAVLGGARLCCPSAGEPVADHLARLAQHGVTHISGTPSHWRRALMSPASRSIAPRYVRLSGEIADQADPRQSARSVSAAQRRPRLCLDRGRRRIRCR